MEREPAVYVLPEVKARTEGAANWFRLLGDLDLSVPMEFPEGRYSVKDTMETLARSSEALGVVREAVKLAANFDLAPGVGMWDMMKFMTPEGIITRRGAKMPRGFLESLNAKLIRIDRV